MSGFSIAWSWNQCELKVMEGCSSSKGSMEQWGSEVAEWGSRRGW